MPILRLAGKAPCRVTPVTSTLGLGTHIAMPSRLDTALKPERLEVGRAWGGGSTRSRHGPLRSLGNESTGKCLAPSGQGAAVQPWRRSERSSSAVGRHQIPSPRRSQGRFAPACCAAQSARHGLLQAIRPLRLQAPLPSFVASTHYEWPCRQSSLAPATNMGGAPSLRCRRGCSTRAAA